MDWVCVCPYICFHWLIYWALTLLYRFFIGLYAAAIRFSALWNEKAKRWVYGRKNLFETVAAHIPAATPLIWVHASSAGEFEQAKPVIERLKELYPHYFILVTFFSPSGYMAAQKYAHAGHITYIPLDTPANAERFIAILKPQLVVFVKYDFWYFHLKAIARHHIPLLLISSTFRPGQVFFKWYGNFYRKILHFFTHIFVQDAASLSLLQANGITHGSISGDTRFDRVAAITQHFTAIPHIADFSREGKTIVAGSTWGGDEELIAQVANLYPDYKWIVAPHEVDVAHILQLQQRFANALLYSEVKTALEVQPYLNNTAAGKTHEDMSTDPMQKLKTATILIIDNIGMLSRLYHYGSLCYIGGGFTKDGIHNILEAAVYGKPVIFGPNYQKYREAVELIEKGGAFSIPDAAILADTIKALEQPEAYRAASEAAKDYVAQNEGATETIIGYIQENRLLTN